MRSDEQAETSASPVDVDHEKLVGLIDELRLMILSRDDPSAIGEVLDDLASFASYESANEEALVRSARPPHWRAHRRHLREMAQQLSSLQKRFEYEPDALEREELYDCVSEWLVHVLGEDVSALVPPGVTRPAG
jgi:hemerythrin-like metal-binding protein